MQIRCAAGAPSMPPGHCQDLRKAGRPSCHIANSTTQVAISATYGRTCPSALSPLLDLNFVIFVSPSPGRRSFRVRVLWTGASQNRRGFFRLPRLGLLTCPRKLCVADTNPGHYVSPPWPWFSPPEAHQPTPLPAPPSRRPPQRSMPGLPPRLPPGPPPSKASTRGLQSRLQPSPPPARPRLQPKAPDTTSQLKFLGGHI
jgi:hypothetical protein